MPCGLRKMPVNCHVGEKKIIERQLVSEYCEDHLALRVLCESLNKHHLPPRIPKHTLRDLHVCIWGPVSPHERRYGTKFRKQPCRPQGFLSC